MGFYNETAIIFTRKYQNEVKKSILEDSKNNKSLANARLFYCRGGRLTTIEYHIDFQYFTLLI